MAAPELNLIDYWRIVRKRKVMIVLIVLVCAFVGWFYSTVRDERAVSPRAVMIEEPRSIATGGDMDFFYSSTDFIATQSELIKSRKVAEDAAIVLGWLKEGMSQSEHDAIINSIQGSISTACSDSSSVG